MATRAEQLAEAYLAVATANHYMVGIVDSMITADERDEAEQILITQQNAIGGTKATRENSLINVGVSRKVYDLALDLIEQDKRSALHRASRGEG